MLPVRRDVPSDAVSHHDAFDICQLGYQYLVVLEVRVEYCRILLYEIEGDPFDVVRAYVSHECHLRQQGG